MYPPVRINLSLVLIAVLATGLLGLATYVNAEVFGDGSDGSITVSGTYDMVADMNWQDITVDSGSTLETHGYVIRVAGTLIIVSVLKRRQLDNDGGLLS